MRVFVLLLALFFVLSLSLYSAYGLVMPMSTEQILDEFDLIVLGTITNIKTTNDLPSVFQIEIEESVKPNSFDQKTVDALGCDPNDGAFGVPCPNYKEGERGLFLIQKSDNAYDLSFRSQVAEANCTAEQFLSNFKNSRNSFYWKQNGQSDTFFTGEPVDITFIVHNRNLGKLDYSIQFTAGTKGSTFTDMINGTVGECIGYKTITTSFIPTEMGTYSFSNRHGTGGSSSYGTAIIDYGSSPREQFNAGVHGQETWCREGLFLILKNDDTKPRADNQPACVTAETIDILVKRDWGFIPPESNASGHMGKK